MLKAGAGGSTSANAREAARQAARAAMERLGEPRADLVVAFLGGDHHASYAEMLSAIRVTTGCERITGGSGLGVMTLDEEMERGPGVAVLALSDCQGFEPFLLPGLDGLGDAQGTHLAELLRPHVSAGSTLALFADPFSFSPPLAFSAIEGRLGAPATVGGLCSGPPAIHQTWQVQGTRAESAAVAGMVVPPSVHVVLGVAHGCRPIGRSYAITRGHGNQIAQIGGRPAIEVLNEAIRDVAGGPEGRRVGAIFLGIAIDPAKHPLERGDFLVRHIVGIDPSSGAIAVGDFVRVGQTVRIHLLDADTAHEDMLATIARVRETLSGRRPRFGLYFDCLGRGEGLFHQPRHDMDVLREALGEFPLVGFFGNGEIAPVGGRNLLHSYTGVLLLVTE